MYVDRVAGAELLLNHFTPGDGYEFTHQVVQKGAKKWKLYFQKGVPNRVRVAGVFPCEGWRVLQLLLLFCPLDTRVLARSGENIVRAAKDKDVVLTNHARTIYHQDACVPSKAFLLTHINPNTRIDATLDQDRQKLSDMNKHVLGVTVGTMLLCGVM